MEASSIRCLISAGPTREYLDPVRFLSNPSTGRMGFALAEAATARGWSVTLVAGPVELSTPAGVARIDVETGDEMHRALEARFDDCNILIMTAAVMDYRPRGAPAREGEEGSLEHVCRDGADGRHPRHARCAQGPSDPRGLCRRGRTMWKLTPARSWSVKNLDWIAANEVGRAGTGFASTTNQLLLLGRGGQRIELGEGLKTSLAVRLLDKVSAGHRDSSSVCVP